MTTCVFCGGAGDEDHRVTGCGSRRRYLNAELWVPACPECNKVDHHGWRVAGLDQLLDGPDIGRLRRIAWFFGRLGSKETETTLPPRVWLALAGALRDIVDRLAKGAR
jgi:hypothetical protein